MLAAAKHCAGEGFAKAEDKVAQWAVAWRAATPEEAAASLQRVEAAAAVTADPHRALYLRSVLARVTSDPDRLIALIRHVEPLPLETRLFVLHALNAHYRDAMGSAAAQLRRHTLYRGVVEEIARSITLPAPIPRHERDDRIIVCVIQQFLRADTHAPTRDLLNYARVFIQTFNRLPVIINANQFAMTPPTAVHAPFLGARLDRYDAMKALSFGDLQIPFRQVTAPMPDLPTLEGVLRMIAEAKPALVIGHGATNVLADLCARFTDVAIHQTTEAMDPFAAPATFLVREPRAQDEAVLAGLGRNRDAVIVTRPAIELPASDAVLTRADLDAPDDAVLVGVIGNRLDQELTPTFLAALDAACAQAPGLCVRTAGKLDQGDGVFAPYPALAARARHTGYQNDVRAFCRALDIVANPARQGGGTSAAMALDAGAIIVTPPVGDVAVVAGPHFHVADEAAISEALVTLARNPQERALRRDAARARGAAIQDVPGLWREALEAFAQRAAPAAAD